MKKLKKHLLITAFLAVLTLSASLFTTSNLLIQAAFAQTTGGNTGTGPQDGGDGKRKGAARQNNFPRPEAIRIKATDKTESKQQN